MAATDATQRRQRTSLKLLSGCIVCQETELIGDVTIGRGTVVHPRARIIAEAGPIVIGEDNIIEEQVTIINRLPTSSGHGVGAAGAAVSAAPDEGITMVIGNGNLLEVGCYIEASKIGDDNVVECKARVGAGVELTSGCVIGCMCDAQTMGVLPANTVLFGTRPEFRVQVDKPQSQMQQLEFLSKILPNYHRLRKGSATSAQPAVVTSKT